MKDKKVFSEKHNQVLGISLIGMFCLPKERVNYYD